MLLSLFFFFLLFICGRGESEGEKWVLCQWTKSKTPDRGLDKNVSSSNTGLGVSIWRKCHKVRDEISRLRHGWLSLDKGIPNFSL